jgi:hypothetical protein
MRLPQINVLKLVQAAAWSDLNQPVDQSDRFIKVVCAEGDWK